MAEQKRYSLSDADMLGINERIDNSGSASDVIYNAITATWNAILSQDGTSLTEIVSELSEGQFFDPTEYAIPFDQAIEIMERMKSRLMALNISDLGITNAMLDWSNVGPSTYNDMPKTQSTDGILPPPSNNVSTPPIAALVHIPPRSIGAHPSIVDKDDLVNMDE